MSWNNPTPVAVCLIPVETPTGTALLGIVRNNEIGQGSVAFPGGYLEEGENAQAAASRELNEEVGLVLEPSRWSVFDTQTNASNKLLVFCRYQGVLSWEAFQALTVVNPAEVSGYRLITRELVERADADQVIAFGLHLQAARKYFAWD